MVIATSDMKGRCYIETKNLDGETNKKIRMVEQKTMFQENGYSEDKFAEESPKAAWQKQIEDGVRPFS